MKNISKLILSFIVFFVTLHASAVSSETNNIGGLLPSIEAEITRALELKKRENLLSQRDKKSSMRYLNSPSGNLYSMNNKNIGKKYSKDKIE